MLTLFKKFMSPKSGIDLLPFDDFISAVYRSLIPLYEISLQNEITDTDVTASNFLSRTPLTINEAKAMGEYFKIIWEENSAHGLFTKNEFEYAVGLFADYTKNSDYKSSCQKYLNLNSNFNVMVLITTLMMGNKLLSKHPTPINTWVIHTGVPAAILINMEKNIQQWSRAEDLQYNQILIAASKPIEDLDIDLKRHYFISKSLVALDQYHCAGTKNPSDNRIHLSNEYTSYIVNYLQYFFDHKQSSVLMDKQSFLLGLRIYGQLGPALIKNSDGRYTLLDIHPSPVVTFMVALMIAHKVLHDSPYNNYSWALITGFPLDDINITEANLLEAIDYQIDQSPLTPTEYTSVKLT